MSVVNVFHTPEMRNETEIVVKKSRFIGHVMPVMSVDEAEAALDEIRTKHKTATHNCYAYRIGLNVPVERFSDDGEPSGTAGRPILEVLRRKPLTNLLVVVTRYFGGTLLGANGLVHAYTDSTVDVLDNTSVLECRRMVLVTVTCDYAQYGKLEYEVNGLGHTMLDKVFTDKVTFTLWIDEQDAEGFVGQVSNWSNGQASCALQDAEYVGIRPDGSFVSGVWSDALEAGLR